MNSTGAGRALTSLPVLLRRGRIGRAGTMALPEVFIHSRGEHQVKDSEKGAPAVIPGSALLSQAALPGEGLAERSGQGF